MSTDKSARRIVYKERVVPFEVVGLTAAAVIGLIVVFSDVVPNSIADTLPRPFQYGWGIALLVGSAIALVGVIGAGSRGVFFEQIGIFAAGAACLVYAAAVVAYRPEVTSVMSFGMVAAYGIACMWRFTQLVQLVHQAQAILDGQSDQERG